MIDWQQETRNFDADIRYWLDGDADPQKVTLGLAFQGHYFIISDPGRCKLNQVQPKTRNYT